MEKKDTRGRILEVSRELFARKGFAGVSVDEISERVGIKKASIYHHFESKQQIYEALIQIGLSELLELFKKSYSDKGIIEGTKKFFEDSIDFAANNQDYAKMLVREVLDENLPIRQFVKTYLPKLIKEGEAIVRQGQKAGIFRKGIDIIQLSISLTGLVLTYFVFSPLIEPLLGEDVTSPQAIEKRKKAIVDLVFFGLLTDKARAQIPS